VLITGDTSPELLKLAHESGFVILHKPLQPRELVRLVERWRDDTLVPSPQQMPADVAAQQICVSCILSM